MELKRGNRILQIICIFAILSITIYTITPLSAARDAASMANYMKPKTFKTGNSLTRAYAAAEFLEVNEAVRQRYLDKREAILFKKMSLKKTAVWNNDNVFIWHYFPPTFTCPHIVERIGTPKDGGKWLCGLELFETYPHKCIIYSFGVGEDSSFELEILRRTNCEIFAFDYTKPGMKFGEEKLTYEEEQRMHFYKYGLGDRETALEKKEFRTLGQIMEENGHDWIDYLKVDIEGSEYNAFKSMADEFPEGFPFGHLNLEVHLPYENNNQVFMKFYNFWNILESHGLRAFTWEDNHVTCNGKEGSRPRLMEYSFVNVLFQRNLLLQF